MNSTTARPRRLLAAAAILALPAAFLGAVTGPAPGDGPGIEIPVAVATDPVRLRAAPINLTAAKRVEAGTRIQFSGSLVVKRKPRVVELSERVGTQWRTVARKRSTKGGTFQIKMAAGRTAKVRIFRASAPAAPGLSPLRTGRLRLRVVPPVPATPTPPPTPTSPTDEASDWSYLFEGGARWNPCEPIRWVYNPAGQRYDALADVTTAFANIAAASGLTFQYAGTSSYRYLGAQAGFPAGVDIAVAWADESELEVLSGDVVGVGGGYAYPTSGQDVQWEFVRGYLTLDSGGSVTPPPGYDGPGWGQVMMHEVLHALGLGHARLGNQLMYPMATSQNYRFGLGDLTGMTKIGAPAGCLS